MLTDDLTTTLPMPEIPPTLMRFIPAEDRGMARYYELSIGSEQVQLTLMKGSTPVISVVTKIGSWIAPCPHPDDVRDIVKPMADTLVKWVDLAAEMTRMLGVKVALEGIEVIR